MDGFRQVNAIWFRTLDCLLEHISEPKWYTTERLSIDTESSSWNHLIVVMRECCRHRLLLKSQSIHVDNLFPPHKNAQTLGIPPILPEPFQQQTS